VSDQSENEGFRPEIPAFPHESARCKPMNWLTKDGISELGQIDGSYQYESRGFFGQKTEFLTESGGDSSDRPT